MAETVAIGSVVVPGDKLGLASEFESGDGTYVRGLEIFAAVVGTVKSGPQASSSDASASSDSSKNVVLSVESSQSKPTIVPKEKSVVLAQVVKITPRFAQVAIVSVDNVTLSDYFPGTIRVNDVQVAQPEQVEIYKCFRPGDLVRAEVISLGDSRAYYLTTAKPEYGVVMAKSISGHTMSPISWNLMQCPKTKLKEYRKVAKTS
jgi:exosome complex component CSL4